MRPTPRYQHYLESVLEGADEYQEVPDLLMRHATLCATNKDLRDHQHKCRSDEGQGLGSSQQCRHTWRRVCAPGQHVQGVWAPALLPAPGHTQPRNQHDLRALQ